MQHLQRDEKATPTVLNLVLLGTGYHHLQSEKRHLLTEFAKATNTQDKNQFVHIIDGLGGAPDTKNPDAKNHPMAGTYTVGEIKLQQDEKTGNQIHVSKQLKGTVQSATRAGGMVRGVGYHDSIHEAVQIADTLVKAGKQPLVINMVGFSRGADTALRISNVLNTLYGKEVVKVNIFAIDPVPGTGRRKAKKGRLIPDNVGDYQSILMMDERNPLFEPQDRRRLIIQDPNTTHVSTRMYGGKHGTALNFHADPTADAKADAKIETLDSARMVWEDLRRFAARHGTTFSHPMAYLQKTAQKTFVESKSEELSDEKRLAIYSRMGNNRAHYARMQNSGSARQFLSSKEDYFLHGTDYFQDQEHQALFSQQYPKFFDRFFQMGKEFGLTDATNAELKAEMTRMKTVPELVTSLKKAGYPDLSRDLDAIAKEAPRGIPVTVRELGLNKQGEMQSELARLWHGVQIITNQVLVGNDTSIDEKIARQLKKSVIDILKQDATLTDKAKDIQVEIIQAIYENQDKPEFTYKLAGLMGGNIKVYADIADQLLRRMEQSLLLEQVSPEHKKTQQEMVSLTKAQRVLIGKIVGGNAPEKEKVEHIALSMRLLHDHISKRPDFPSKEDFVLPALQSFSEVQLRTGHCIDHATKKLNQYIQRFEWFSIFRDTVLTENKKKIAKLTIDALHKVGLAGFGDDKEVINRILNLASNASARLRETRDNKAEGEFDKMLRQSILDIAHFSSSTKSTEQQDKINEIIEAYKKEVIQVIHVEVAHQAPSEALAKAKEEVLHKAEIKADANAVEAQPQALRP